MKTLKDYEYFRTDLGVLYCGDCLEIMPMIEDKVDLILTDPSFNVKLKYESINDDMQDDEYRDWCLSWINDLYKLLNNKHYAIIFTGDIKSYWIFDAIMKSQFIFHHFIKWYKPNSQGALTGTVLFYRTELSFLISKNKPDIKLINRKILYQDTLIHNITSKKDKDAIDHNARRPIPLYLQLIKGFTSKNDLILDVFLGSGTTAVACEKLGRRWIGIEISEKYCEIAKQRIKKEADQLKLL